MQDDLPDDLVFPQDGPAPQQDPLAGVPASAAPIPNDLVFPQSLGDARANLESAEGRARSIRRQAIEAGTEGQIAYDPTFAGAAQDVANARRAEEAARDPYGAFGQSWGTLTPGQSQAWIPEAASQAQTALEQAQAQVAGVQQTIDGLLAERAARGDTNTTIPGPLRADLGYAQGRLAEAQRERARIAQIERGEASPALLTPTRSAVENVGRAFVDVVAAGVLKSYGAASAYIANQLPGPTVEPDDNLIYNMGEAISRWARDTFPGDTARQQEFAQQLAQGGGSMLGFLGPSMTAAVMGAGPRAMTAISALFGGAAQGSEAFDEASRALLEIKERHEEATGQKILFTPMEQDRLKALGLNFLTGTSEALPLSRVFQGSARSGVRGRLQQGLVQGAEEGTQEFGQQLATNAIASQTYDPDRPLDRGVGEGTGIGFLLGAGMGVAMRPHVPPPPTPPPVPQQDQVPPVPPQEPAGPQAAISGFYAPAERAMEASRRVQGPAQAWLNDLKKAGVSNDELDWMGFPQWMEENRGRPISREEVAEFVRENGANLVEMVQDLHRVTPVQFANNFPAGVTNPRNFLVQVPGLNYESPHFGGPTVSFIRVGDIAGPNGERVLLVHGNQSELHQEAERGRGYKSDEDAVSARDFERVMRDQLTYSEANAVNEVRFGGTTVDDQYLQKLQELRVTKPDAMRVVDAYMRLEGRGVAGAMPNAPLKGDRWWQLGLKLALRQAVAEGYDAVAISTADQVKATDGNAPKSLYDSKMPSWLGKYVKPMGGVVESSEAVIGHRSALFSREAFRGFHDDPARIASLANDIEAEARKLSWFTQRGLRNELFELANLVRNGHYGAAEAIPVRATEEALELLFPTLKRAGLMSAARGNPTVRITPQMRESISKGQPLFAGSASLAKRHQNIETILSLGRPYNVLPSAVKSALANISTNPYVRANPDPDNAGVVSRIEPIPGLTPSQGILVTARTASGGTVKVRLSWPYLSRVRAVHFPGHLTSTGDDLLLFVRLDPVAGVDKRIVGEYRHELVHLLRSKGFLRGPVWVRLLAHADLLRIKEYSSREYLFNIGSETYDRQDPSLSIEDVYRYDIYLGHPPDILEELLDQEAVAHMLELHHHGFYSDEQMAPVRDILDAMESGALTGGVGAGAVSEPAMAIAGPRGSSGPMFAIGGGGHTSLVPFIRAHGGMKDVTGDLKHILDKSGTKGHIPGIINNKTGVHPDRMRGYLVEAGYLKESGPDQPAITTVNDVYDLVRRAASGEKILPFGEQPSLPEPRNHERDQIINEAVRILDSAGMEYYLTEAEEARVVGLVNDGLSIDDAIERATMESGYGIESGDRKASRKARRRPAAQGEEFPGWEPRAELPRNEGAGTAGVGEGRAPEAAGTGIVPVTPPPVPPSSGGGSGMAPPGGGRGGRGGPPGGDVIPPDGGRGGPRSVGVSPTIDGSRNWSIGDWARAARDKWYSLGRTMETWWNPINGLPQLEQYRIGRYRMLGRIGHGETMTNGIWKDFKGASKADKKAAYTYLTTRGVSPNGIADPKVRAAAVATKNLFNALGIAAVDRGLISQEALDKYRDQYLPRLYLEHILRKGSMLGFSGNARPSDLGWTNHRADIDKETRVLMGEILDPGYLAARGIFRMHRDMMIIDFLSEISNNDDWVFDRGLVDFNGKRVSPYFLRAEAQALRERADYEPDDGYRDAMLSMATDMENAAAPFIRENENVPDGYKQIPDSKRYGMLRGMYVRKEIVDDLLPSMSLIPEDANWFEKFISPQGGGGKFNALWKAYHVPLNPSTQFRNTIGNVVLMNLSGMGPIRIAEALGKAVHQMATKGPIYKTAVDMGLKTSGFSEQELRNVSRAWLDAEAVLRREKAWGTIFYPWQIVKHVHDTVLRGAGDLYQYSEGLFKTAMMIDAVENQGMTPEQAFLHAQKWLFDYSDVSKGVRYLRGSPVGVPFASFYYKVLPRLIEVGATKPWRFLPYAILPYVIGQLFMNAWDAHDDDEEKKRHPNRPNPVDRLAMALPEYLRTKSYAFIMPWQDARGRWQFFDFGYLLPWGTFHEAGQSLAKGDITGAMRQVGFLGGPLLNLYQFIASKGTDSFTGRKVIDPRDPTSTQIFNTMQWVWDQTAPPLITSKGALSKLFDAYNEVPDRSGDPGLTVAQAWSRLFGLNVYPVDPATSRGRQISRMAFEIKEAEKRMRSIQRDQSLSAEARRRETESRAADIARRRRELSEYATNSEVHPRLDIQRPRRTPQPPIPNDLIFPQE